MANYSCLAGLRYWQPNTSKKYYIHVCVDQPYLGEIHYFYVFIVKYSIKITPSYETSFL
jgi:hypothetical protein